MYILSPTARREIAECGRYVLDQTGSLDAAEAWLASMLDTFSRIAQSPHSGRPRPELRRGLRSCLSGTYTVFYRIRLAGVEIARVLHQRRDLRKAFPRRGRGGGATRRQT